MSYYLPDYAATARERQAESDSSYYRARKYARDAEENYRLAAEWRKHAAWLTRRPEYWDDSENTDPALWERVAARTQRYADSLLQHSFRYTERARHYAQEARDYRQMDADQKAGWAALNV